MDYLMIALIMVCVASIAFNIVLIMAIKQCRFDEIELEDEVDSANNEVDVLHGQLNEMSSTLEGIKEERESGKKRVAVIVFQTKEGKLEEEHFDRCRGFYEHDSNMYFIVNEFDETVGSMPRENVISTKRELVDIEKKEEAK